MVEPLKWRFIGWFLSLHCWQKSGPWRWGVSFGFCSLNLVRCFVYPNIPPPFPMFSNTSISRFLDESWCSYLNNPETSFRRCPESCFWRPPNIPKPQSWRPIENDGVPSWDSLCLILSIEVCKLVKPGFFERNCGCVLLGLVPTWTRKLFIFPTYQ